MGAWFEQLDDFAITKLSPLALMVFVISRFVKADKTAESINRNLTEEIDRLLQRSEQQDVKIEQQETKISRLQEHVEHCDMTNSQLVRVLSVNGIDVSHILKPHGYGVSTEEGHDG